MNWNHGGDFNETDGIVTGDSNYEISRSLWGWQKNHLTQKEAAQLLGIEMIPAYSPEARGQSKRIVLNPPGPLGERASCCRHHRYVPPANKYVQEVYMHAFNRELIKKTA